MSRDVEQLVQATIADLVSRQEGIAIFHVNGTENRYVQFGCDKQRMLGECVSNAFLPDDERLTNSDEAALVDMGWNAPSSGNFSREWKSPFDAQDIANFASLTLLGIHGAGAHGIRVERF